MNPILLKIKQIEAYGNRIVSMEKIVDDALTALGAEIRSLEADLQRARDHRAPPPANVRPSSS